MFTVKTYKKGKESKADFYVQSKGQNAGQPLKEAIANCFEIKVTDTDNLLPEYLYYMVLNAFNQGAFRKYIQGAAVPYLTIENFTKALIEFYS